jgi:hypothetical protein
METDLTFYLVLLVTAATTFGLLRRRRPAPQQAPKAKAGRVTAPKPVQALQPLPEGPLVMSAAQFRQALKLAKGDTRKITPAILAQVIG